MEEIEVLKISMELVKDDGGNWKYLSVSDKTKKILNTYTMIMDQIRGNDAELYKRLKNNEVTE